jgi:hypothetical protein
MLVYDAQLRHQHDLRPATLRNYASDLRRDPLRVRLPAIAQQIVRSPIRDAAMEVEVASGIGLAGGEIAQELGGAEALVGAQRRAGAFHQRLLGRDGSGANAGQRAGGGESISRCGSFPAVQADADDRPPTARPLQ